MTVLSWILLFSRREKNGCPQDATRSVSREPGRPISSTCPRKTGPYVDLVFPRLSDWNRIASRAKRRLSSIVLDDDIKELLLEDARDFLKSKWWCADPG